MKVSQVKRAILLVAGRGRRLGALTETRPKCLVDVAGQPILERAVSSLAECGISELVLVVGYRKEQIREYLDSNNAGLRVDYVENPKHSETGTSYSLWLARGYLDEDVLLLEGDILFDSQTLGHILRAESRESVWGAVPVAPGLDEGILLCEDERGYVSRVERFPDSDTRDRAFGFKCGGIQLLQPALARKFALRLDEAVQAGQVKAFADLILAHLLPEHPMRLRSLDGMRWAEIDDPEDLRRASKIFAESPSPEVAEAGH